MYAMTSLKENPEIIKPGGASAVLAPGIKIFTGQTKPHFLIKSGREQDLLAHMPGR